MTIKKGDKFTINFMVTMDEVRACYERIASNAEQGFASFETFVKVTSVALRDTSIDTVYTVKAVDEVHSDLSDDEVVQRLEGVIRFIDDVNEDVEIPVELVKPITLQ